MEAKNKVRRETVERVHQRFQALPDYDPDEMTTTEAVRRLLPDIHALQTRGYSLNTIADLLSEDGIAISGASLKALMRHATDKKKRSKARRTAPLPERARAADEGKRKSPAPREVGGAGALAAGSADETLASVVGGRKDNGAPPSPLSEPGHAYGSPSAAGEPANDGVSVSVLAGREENPAAPSAQPPASRFNGDALAAGEPANQRITPSDARKGPLPGAADVTGSLKQPSTSERVRPKEAAPTPPPVRRSAFIIRKDSENI